MTWTVTSEVVELRVGLVVQFTDVFTGQTPSQLPRVELEIELPDLDRDDRVVMVNGQEVRRFRPSGLRGYGTVRRRVSFPGLDRMIAPHPALGGTQRRYRLGVEGIGTIADPSQLEVDVPNGNGPVVADVDLFPAPDYPFGAHVIVLNGIVGPFTSPNPLRLQVRKIGTSVDPAESAMTSWTYLGRGPFPGLKLPFRLALRASRVPFTIEVSDATTNTLLHTFAVDDLTVSIDLTLP